MSQVEVSQEKSKPICFVIMPISDVHGYEPGHFGRVYEHILKPAIIAAGYLPVRADDTIKTDYIVVGIIQKIVESEMVICDFSARNPNVMYELGIRHAFNKPVALIKDRRTDKVFDIQGLRYVEYDDSLRIDTVQKDISKITGTIRETATAGAKGVNSVVQLAGITAAVIPEKRQVSGDTQLILSAIAALERRVENVETKGKPQVKFFTTDDEKVVFSDTTEATLGDEVYDGSGNSIGTLVDIHPADEKIYLKQDDGKIIPYAANSVRSKGISLIPF